MAGVGVGVLVVALVVAALTLRDDTGEPATGTGSPATPTASAAVASNSVAPSPGGTPTAQAPSPTPSAQETVPEEWIASATFSEPGRRYAVGDMAAWSDGLVAVGTRYESDGRGVFGPPPAHEGRVWRSTDGTGWADATPANIFDQVELQHLFETTDGGLIVIGDVWTGVDRASAAWTSRDGESWEPVVLAGIAANAWVLRVVSGAKGHLAAVHTGAEVHALYSADGRQWELTISDSTTVNDVSAGDEGFVASIFRGDPGESTRLTVASSDGLQWFDATSAPDGAAMVAPRRGDWFAAATSFGEVLSVAAWHSANGLDWSPLGDVPLGSFGLPDLTCFEAPGAIHGLPGLIVVGTVLSGPCSEGAVIAAGASYASLDGVDWTRLPFGDQAFAAGAVLVGDRVIVRQMPGRTAPR